MDIERINNLLKEIVQDINNYNNIKQKKTYTLLEKDDVMLEVKEKMLIKLAIHYNKKLITQ